MGFESTIDILDDDVNDTANFLMRESDLDSITDNNNNFTYDDGDMTGDDVTVDPKELLLDHTNNNNLAPLIIRAKTNENNAKLYLPTDYLEELEGYVSREEHLKMIEDIEQIQRDYMHYWLIFKFLTFWVVMLLITIVILSIFITSELVACIHGNDDVKYNTKYSDGDSIGHTSASCSMDNVGDYAVFLTITVPSTFGYFIMLGFIYREMKPLILSLPEHLALKNDEERERRITEVVEKMSDETFGTRVQYRIEYTRVQYRTGVTRIRYKVLIYLQQ